MTLSGLLVAAKLDADAQLGDAVITSMTADSRAVQPGALFVCMPNAKVDTHDFLPEAASKGAVAVVGHDGSVIERARALNLGAAVFLESNGSFAKAIGPLAATFYGNPSRFLTMIGVTGTNGKTTTAWIVTQALRQLGRRAGYIGTIGFEFDQPLAVLPNTTPFPVELQALLALARDRGMTDVAMEVSSHALAERRVDGTEFDVGVWTNLTQDHLDFHGDMVGYEMAKQRLFTELPLQTSKPFSAVINSEDEAGARLLAKSAGHPITFGWESGDLRVRQATLSPTAADITLEYRGQSCAFWLPLGGRFNVENVLAATGALLSLGYELAEIGQALSHVSPAPGRFEPVNNDKGISVIVDYAHTPDALTKLLAAARENAEGKVVVLFGCGGDRDATKRPLMGAAAAEGADLVVLTSDNPRSEDPMAILAGIQAGIPDQSKVIVEPDRPTAVRSAIQMAKRGDVVVLAGKGHEQYQIIGDRTIPMSDVAMAQEALG